MAGGRPTIYREKMCDQVVKLMSEGLTFTAALFEIGVSRAVAYTWLDPKSDVFKPQFLDAKKRGEEGFEHWLANHFRNGMYSDAKYPFNTTAAIWLSKAVCKWQDPATVKGEKDDNNININLSYDPKKVGSEE